MAKTTQPVRRESVRMNSSHSPRAAGSLRLIDAPVLVLSKLAVLDLFFPACLVPLLPLRPARERLIAPGKRVGLALILALLGGRRPLLHLHSTREHNGGPEPDDASHDLPPVAGAGACPGAAGAAPLGGGP